MDPGSPDAVAPSSGADPTAGLHWAQGKAGEDRVHVVVSDERGWVFVGIYDGFNGPDATDFLVSNLYAAVHHELRGQHQQEDQPASTTASDHPRRSRSRPPHGPHDDQRRWERDCSNLDPPRTNSENDHIAVLKALARALRKTEEAYLGVADKMVAEFPELALMGSCVLAMLMKGEHLYIMSVGDSRAVLGTMGSAGLEHVSAGSFDGLMGDCSPPCLSAVQLTSDHSTSVPEVIEFAHTLYQS
jgi:serine/threonine protein phosphatase PrpC